MVAEEGDPDLFQTVECWCPGRACLDSSICIEWKKGWRNLWQDHINERRPQSYTAGWENVLSKSETREIVIAELLARLGGIRSESDISRGVGCTKSHFLHVHHPRQKSLKLAPSIM